MPRKKKNPDQGLVDAIDRLTRPKAEPVDGDGTVDRPHRPTKRKCHMSLKFFLENARPMLVKLGPDGAAVTLKVKEFKTGSFGWMVQADKATLMVGDVPVAVQCGINIVVINSKEAPRE